MDALKKAEEAKRVAGEGKAAEAPPRCKLELSPLDAPATQSPPAGIRHQTPPSGASPLPELALHTDSVDADLAAVSRQSEGKPFPHRSKPAPSSAATPKITNGSATEDTERALVRNVFSAKQPSERRSALWIILPVSALITAGIGAYFWWQLQALSTGSLAVPAPRPASASTPTMQPAPTPPNAPTEAKLPASLPATNEPVIGARQAEPAATASTEKGNRSVQPSAENTQQSPQPVRQNTNPLAPEPSQPEPDRQFRLTRSQPAANMTLEQAYDALQAGRLDSAERTYERVLRSDAKNTDALLGLATIAAQRNNMERAHSYYLRALESDPNDPTAQAGVIQTRGQTDPAQSESRLKNALANQPDSPALLFALGNLYAREQRWGEAQQAYFRAYSTEPDNPDFIFNLAVSLDQLHQDKLAAQYYQMALNAAETAGRARAVGFDQDQARQRIQELLP